MKLTELEIIVDNYVSLFTESEYQDFFKKMLRKYGVKSPFQLDEEKRKQFFNEIKKGWAEEKMKKNKK